MEEVDQSIHQRAGQGELRSAELDQEVSNIDVRDRMGKTPLMWSAAYGQTPTVALLIQKGAVSQKIFVSTFFYSSRVPVLKGLSSHEL